MYCRHDERRGQRGRIRAVLHVALVSIMTLSACVAMAADSPANPESDLKAPSGSPGAGQNSGGGSDGAAQFFLQKCAGCHTIGKGALVGPDLNDTSTWKTADLTANVKRMEKFAGPLGDETVVALVEFLKDTKAKDRLKAEETRESEALKVTAEPASPVVGMKLFAGKDRFQNGGMACIACHQVGGQGGTMGKDLSDAFEKLGQQALVSTCEQPSYPVMKAIYKDHPLTKQEALHVTGYLATLKGSGERHADPPYALLGLAGAASVLLSLLYFYRNRNTGAHARLERRRKNVVD